MKTKYSTLVILYVLLFTTNIFAQAASVTWKLDGTTQLSSANIGNVTGSSESISAGSGRFGMSVFDYNSNGQRLWEGTAGWIAGTEESTRYTQFDALPSSENSFTITNVSFNYGAAGIDNNIQSNTYYSTDGWKSRTLLNPSPLSYPGSGMSSFTQNISVTLPSGATFSVRIYPYSVVNSSPMAPTFAVQNNVVISGTTSSKKNSILQVTNAAGKWGKSVLLTVRLQETGPAGNTNLPGRKISFSRESDTSEVPASRTYKFINSGTTDANGVASISYTIPQDSVLNSLKAPQDSVAHTIKAEFAGDANYSSQSGMGKLTVVRHATSISVSSVNGIYGQPVTFAATLTDNDNGGKGISNQVLTFKISESQSPLPTDRATTNADGAASLIYKLPQDSVASTHVISAVYSGDGNYSSQTGTGKLTNTLSGVKKNQVDIPVKYDLSQNYPNPFNPTSTIRYDIPKTGFVNISVYDILGREVRALVNEQKSPGHYEVLFDAKELASGIYFYSIRSADFTQIKKMILMK
jgi:hypothetical protein